MNMNMNYTSELF